MTDSDSSLSSPPSTGDEMPIELEPAAADKPVPQKKKKKNANILAFFKQRSPSPPARKRDPSPPHEVTPADNPYIAFIIMFRSRFNDAFPRSAPHVGPQDIEEGVQSETPSPDVEGLLCALLGLVLNRKKPVEKGHYGRALEEAIQTQKSQWPKQWDSNPISGGRNFNSMNAIERITLLHTLTLWSLNQNEQIKNMITDAYKSRTTKDRLDTNIPLSIQPWGRDGDKRRYWLVEGQSDTHFRVYRESNHNLKKVQWYNVAGSIEELQVLAKKLEEEDGHREAKALSERMANAVPRFEASEGKRKRREYRVQRNVAFTRPEPGFSLYEGRTRGKRLRYTFTDDEDLESDNVSTRRSGRNSGHETPAVPSGPTVTASGRQVRSRAAGLYGETLHSGQIIDQPSPATGDNEQSDMSEEAQQSRATRGGGRGYGNERALNRPTDTDDDDDATSWDGGDEDEDEPDQMEVDEVEEEVGDASDNEEQPSLIVTLRYGKDTLKPTGRDPRSNPTSNAAITNGVSSLAITTLPAPPDAPLLSHPQPAPIPIEPPISPEPPAPVEPPILPTIPPVIPLPNGLPIVPLPLQQPLLVRPPIVPVAQHTSPLNPAPMLPHVDSIIPNLPPVQHYPVNEAMSKQPKQQPKPSQQVQQPVLPVPQHPASTW